MRVVERQEAVERAVVARPASVQRRGARRNGSEHGIETADERTNALAEGEQATDEVEEADGVDGERTEILEQLRERRKMTASRTGQILPGARTAVGGHQREEEVGCLGQIGR